MTATTLTITRRSRVGLAWTNSPERWTDRNGQTSLRISSPGNEPQITGYVRSVYDEYKRIARLNNANDWSWRWFVWSDGEWVAVRLDEAELWMLLNSDPSGKAAPRTDSIEATAIFLTEGRTMKNYEDVTVTISGNGYTVSWYEWTEGQGRDCGLNREQTFGSREDAQEYARELRAKE